MVSPAFRIYAKKFAITYPQATNISKDQVFEFYKALHPSKLIVAEEKHQDGTPHYHIALEFATRYNLRNNREWDIEDRHPNIQACRSWLQWTSYIQKEDSNCLNFGESTTAKRDWSDILDSATRDAFLDAVKTSKPRDYILCYDKIVSFASTHFAEKHEYANTYDHFCAPSECTEWLDTEFKSRDRPKTLMICGPSRIGKTQWARSLGKHIYMCNYFNLDQWDSSADYLILDDIKFENIIGRKALLSGQAEFSLTDKYKRKTHVHWGKPVILLCNEDMNPFKDLVPPELDYYMANIIRVYTDNKFY